MAPTVAPYHDRRGVALDCFEKVHAAWGSAAGSVAATDPDVAGLACSLTSLPSFPRCSPAYTCPIEEESYIDQGPRVMATACGFRDTYTHAALSAMYNLCILFPPSTSPQS